MRPATRGAHQATRLPLAVAHASAGCLLCVTQSWTRGVPTMMSTAQPRDRRRASRGPERRQERRHGRGVWQHHHHAAHADPCDCLHQRRCRWRRRRGRRRRRRRGGWSGRGRRDADQPADGGAGHPEAARHGRERIQRTYRALVSGQGGRAVCPVNTAGPCLTSPPLHSAPAATHTPCVPMQSLTRTCAASGPPGWRRHRAAAQV